MLPLRSITIAVFFLLLAACKPDTAAPVVAPSAGTHPSGPVTPAREPGTAESGAEAAASALGHFRIVSVLLGKAVDADNVVLTSSTVFAKKDALYASVLSTGVNQGLRLSAKWLAPDGATIAETSQPLVPTSATATTFSVSNPKAWPLGKYQVLIGVNGQTLQTRTFEVR